MDRPRRQTLALAAVLVLALAVRLWGIRFGLPYLYDNDEAAIVGRALSFGSGDLNPRSFHWPALHLYVLFFIDGLLYLGGRALGFFHSVDDVRRLAFTDRTLFHMAGRLLSASLGTATVYLVYRLGSRLRDPCAGLFGALCLALSYTHVWDSHVARLDVPAAFWAIVCLAAAFAIFDAREPSVRSYVVAGLLAGLATATKYNGGMIFVAIVAAHFLRASRPPTARLAVAAAAAAAVFFATNPFILVDWRTFVRDFRFQQAHLAEGPLGLATGPAWHEYLGLLTSVQIKDTMTTLFDPMGALLAAGTLATLALDRRRETVILLAAPIAYLAYISSWRMAATRYLDFALPMLAVAAGAWIARLPRAGRAGVALLLLFSARSVVFGDVIRSMPDTRTEARIWFERNIPPKTTIAIETYGPHLAPSVETIDNWERTVASGVYRHPTQSVARVVQFYEWMKESVRPVSYRLVMLNEGLLDADAEAHNRASQTNYDFERLKEFGVRYVVVNSFQYERYDTERARELYPKRASFYQELPARSRLVKEFSPGPWQPGPIVRVYELEPGSVR